jgi:holo-[acyl-carrier protein] synthase
MIAGDGMDLGVDIIEIERIKTALCRRPQLFFRLFTEGERRYFETRNNNAATIAGCFAAKEAAVKAVGGGYLRDVALTWDAGGKPSLTMRGKEGVRFAVSVSHCRAYATASVLAYRVPLA